ACPCCRRAASLSPLLATRWRDPTLAPLSCASIQASRHSSSAALRSNRWNTAQAAERSHIPALKIKSSLPANDLEAGPARKDHSQIPIRNRDRWSRPCCWPWGRRIPTDLPLVDGPTAASFRQRH